MSLSAFIKSALTTLLVGSLSTGSDALYWEEVCSTLGDSSLVRNPQSAEENFAYKQKYEDLETRRLRDELREVVSEVLNLRVHKRELQERAIFLKSEVTRLAAVLNEQEGRENRELEQERKLREELQEENKRYKQKLQENEEVVEMLTTQRNPRMAVQEERRDVCCDQLRGQYSRPTTCEVRFIQPCHPFDEMWKLKI